MEVLVIDIGASNVKMRTQSQEVERRFASPPDLGPEELVRHVRDLTHDWSYDAVSIGYPGAIAGTMPRFEPGNLGDGWVDFDFTGEFGKPVRMVNDAVMQALGSYESGRMLFLGLGTGLGSALVAEQVAIHLELGNLPSGAGDSLGERLGRAGLETHGEAEWRDAVLAAVERLRHTFLAEHIVLGGGNAKRITSAPPHVRLGGNQDAFVGGFRLWEELIEPHDRPRSAAWRVL